MLFNISRICFYCLILIAPTGCLLPPTTEWEDLEGNGETVLNVFGLLSLDPDLESFVRVYRTTDLQELSEILVGRYADADQNNDGAIDEAEFLAATDRDGDGEIGDDEWIAAADTNQDGLIDGGEWSELLTPRYEPAAVVATARVVVSTGTDSILFSWDPKRRAFFSTAEQFIPQPNTSYALHISANGYAAVHGNLITPQIPVFDPQLLADTLHAERPIALHWQPNGSFKALLTGTLIDADLHYDDEDEYDIDCLNIDKIVDLEAGVYTTEFSIFCGKTVPRPYILRLTAMDENYHEYFITGETKDYANTLLSSSTTQGWSVGIEGGYGVFGAIASDTIFRLIDVR